MVPYVNGVLNCAWAAVCLGAFTCLLRMEIGRACGTRRAVTHRVLALSLALVSLFPCVSASDDSVRLQFFRYATGAQTDQTHRPSPVGQTTPLDKKTLATLVRLLEALESVQIGVCLVLSITLCLFALAFIETHTSLERFLPIRAGRAPPVL
jgi:hypothetical protein